jgi:hypothetical protein
VEQAVREAKFPVASALCRDLVTYSSCPWAADLSDVLQPYDYLVELIMSDRPIMAHLLVTEVICPRRPAAAYHSRWR